MAGVQLTGINKSFGSVKVIHDVNLEINDHELIVLVGPSGCGKSTLLRVISGLEESTSGTIMIGDTDVTDEDPSSRGVAMVFQSYALYPHMTVRENIGFGLRMGGMPKDEVAAKVAEAVRILELDELLDRKPKALSGGQRQRVAIGRAIVRDPKVFLFDEPLSNLDAELRVQMRLEIAKLHQNLSATMIYVTHDQVEAMTLADRIVVLRDGVVEQLGTPIELYDDPDNQFVAGFIGSPRMNFLDAKVTKVEGKNIGITLTGFDNTNLVVKSKTGSTAVGNNIVVGIRPEHFVHVDSAEVRLPATAQVVEQLGGVSYVYAQGTQGAPITVQENGHSQILSGTGVSFGIDTNTCHLFDEATLRI